MLQRIGAVFKRCLPGMCAVFLFVTMGVAAPAPQVSIETDYGNIVVELYPDKAPKTVRNFLYYVKTGFYENTVFHRVIGNFMIQGGGFTPEMEQKATTRDPVPNEAANGLSNGKYTVAMARTADPHSATAQFYINVVDNPGLDYRSPTREGYGYTVFGKVVKGMDVVDKIKAVPTGSMGIHNDVPLKPVVIRAVTPVRE